MQTDFIKEFSQADLLVAGEVGIDEYIWGETHRISPEAPVPVVEVQSVDLKLGLSGNVAQNIASLGAKARVLTICGEDEDASRLMGLLEKAGVKSVTALKDPSRPTLRKARVICQKQHVVRVDYERSHALSPRLAKEFFESLCDSLDEVEGVILQDYGKGLWNPDTLGFIQVARQKKKPVFVDPSRSTPLEFYKGVTLLTPNLVEAEVLTRRRIEKSRHDEFPEKHLEAMALEILKTTGCEESIITCGSWGMVAVTQSNHTLRRIPTFAKTVFDVTGAGDTVIAVLSLMKVLGRPLDECMRVANAAAGIVVGQVGAASVTPGELSEELDRLTI